MNAFHFCPGARRWRLAGWLALLACGLAAGPLRARDAFVFISGGGTPLSNNYSQYLQAEAMSSWLQKSYPADSVWIFFGAGNRPGEPVALADVHRQLKENGLLVDTWLPGSLPRNRPATKEAILRALHDEILPAVADGGTLFLFVGDHGELTRGNPPESAITLWQMVRDPRTRWNTDPRETLSVSVLRQAFAAGLGKGRVVFAMTQCHAGGFNFLAAPRAMTVDPAWLTVAPAGAAPASNPVAWRIAGFTAVDEASLAAGCMPNPDPDQWAGYERFFPEKLLGIDLFTGRRDGPALDSFRAAHVAATLVDHTIDKPRSTSEQFLAQWAELIETRLAAAPDLTAAAQTARQLYARVVNGGEAGAGEAALAAKRAEFQEFTAALARQNPAIAKLLLSGTQRELEDALDTGADRRPETPARAGPAQSVQPVHFGVTPEIYRLWSETIRPAWKQAVLTGKAAELPVAAAPFEKHLLSFEDHGRDMMFGEPGALLNEVYWRSGLAEPRTVNRVRADAVTHWAAARRQVIMAWAENSPDAAVRAAGEAWARATEKESGGWSRMAGQRVRAAAVERVLFYRRVLGAWAFLEAVHDHAALDQLHTLIVLENTPLPPARP